MRMESVPWCERVPRKGARLAHYLPILYPPPPPLPAASRTCDLEAKQIIIIIIKKKILVICKSPNSVRLESIVEKEEKPTH